MELGGGGGRCVIQCRQMDNIDLAEYECEYECGRFDFEFYRELHELLDCSATATDTDDMM